MSGPFRIEKSGVSLVGTDKTREPISSYMSKVVKLIPSEVLVAYVAVKGVFPNSADPTSFDAKFLPVWSLIVLIMVVVIRIFGSRATTGSGSLETVQWGVVFVSSISFLTWVYAMGDSILSFSLPDPRLASVAVVIWAIIAPIFFRSTISTD